MLKLFQSSTQTFPLTLSNNDKNNNNSVSNGLSKDIPQHLLIIKLKSDTFLPLTKGWRQYQFLILILILILIGFLTM